jgi:hypothetical protein
MDILILAGIFFTPGIVYIYIYKESWCLGSFLRVSWPELEPGNCHHHRWGAIGFNPLRSPDP